MPDAERPAAETLASALLNWMAIARRDLPWRRRRDPYAVWISEVMLQQTQVATVVPYFERWMAQFPDVAGLAAAPQDAVLKAWEGLGYYARARNLQSAARELVARHGGQIPCDRDALLSLPGVGLYTVGAILSLAFGQAEPVLDGNVRRVLCRVYDIASDPRVAGTETELWSRSRELVAAAPSGKAGDLNEALMELGALVCVPGLPACEVCPIHTDCLARLRGVETDRPLRGVRPTIPTYDVGSAVVRDGEGRYLIARRPGRGLLGGLWEFPSTTAGAGGTGQRIGETLPEFLVREVREKLGVDIVVGSPITLVRHGYTHFRVSVHAFHAELPAGPPRPLGYDEVTWVAPSELDRYPFPVTQIKVLRALELR